MDKENQLKVVKRHLSSIYRLWHQCGLRKTDITPEDEARGLKVGQLCDDCMSMINAHIQDIQNEWEKEEDNVKICKIVHL